MTRPMGRIVAFAPERGGWEGPVGKLARKMQLLGNDVWWIHRDGTDKPVTEFHNDNQFAQIDEILPTETTFSIAILPPFSGRAKIYIMVSENAFPESDAYEGLKYSEPEPVIEIGIWTSEVSVG